MFLLRNNGDVCVQHVRGEPEKEQSGGALQVSSHKVSFSLGGGGQLGKKDLLSNLNILPESELLQKAGKLSSVFMNQG